MATITSRYDHEAADLAEPLRQLSAVQITMESEPIGGEIHDLLASVEQAANDLLDWASRVRRSVEAVA